MIRQVKGFLSSLFRVSKKIVTNEPIQVPQSIFLDRLIICAACPEYDKSLDQCNECWCVIHIKARLDGESCPLKKW